MFSDGSRIQAQNITGDLSTMNVATDDQDNISVAGNFNGAMERGTNSNGRDRFFVGEIDSPNIYINSNEQYTPYSKFSIDIVCANDQRLSPQGEEEILVGEAGFPNQRGHCIPQVAQQISKDVSTTYPLTQGKKTITINYRDAGTNTSKTYSQQIIYDSIAPSSTYTGLKLNEWNVST